MSEPTDPGGGCSCKIGHTIDRYELGQLNDDLRRRREGRDESLRDLADYINKRILESALADGDTDLTNVAYGAVSADDALSAVYETLTNDSAPPDREARVRKRFEQTGVDLDEIESNWVTHPTVRSHFNDCLHVDTGRTSEITAETARNTIEWARTRCSQVVHQTISRLQSAGVVSVRSIDVSVPIHITCSECGNTYRFGELLERESCGCTPDEPDSGPG